MVTAMFLSHTHTHTLTFAGPLNVQVLIEGEYVGVDRLHDMGDVVPQSLLTVQRLGTAQLRRGKRFH